MTGAFGLAARNGLPAALAGGTLHPPAPAVCLLDGLPPRRLRGQGSLRAHECSLGLRPPLDRSGVEAARRDPVARGGRGTAPDQQAPTPTARKEDAMRGCGCLIVALVGLFLGLYIAGSLLTAAVS